LLPGLGSHGQRLFPARGIGWQLLQGGQHLLLQPVLQLAGGRRLLVAMRVAGRVLASRVAGCRVAAG
jgi:hypothetical protein